MEWSKVNVCKLIELFQEKPELWDTSYIHYKNRPKKQDAWADIGAELKIEKGEVEKKMRTLIGQFHREYKKATSGSEADEAKEPKWFAYKLLLFIKDKNMRRRTLEASVENKLETEDYTDEMYTLETTLRPPLSPSSTESTNKSRKRHLYDDDMSPIGHHMCHQTADEFSVIGVNIANKLRKLSTQTVAIVEKLITDVLFEAQCGNVGPFTRVHLYDLRTNCP